MKNKDFIVRDERKKNVTIVLAIIAVMAIGSASAYFTDTKTAVNSFTVGNVSVSLEEPGWKSENGENITPNKEIAKDPKIVNDGVNDAYVFMEVKVPAANIATAKPDGSLNTAALQDLFTYEIDSSWVKVDDASDNTGSTYTYAYVGADGNLKALAPNNETTPIFNSVTFVNAVEGQLDGNDLSIDVKAMAIQTGDLSATAPGDVLDIIKNQRSS